MPAETPHPSEKHKRRSLPEREDGFVRAVVAGSAAAIVIALAAVLSQTVLPSFIGNGDERERTATRGLMEEGRCHDSVEIAETRGSARQVSAKQPGDPPLEVWRYDLTSSLDEAAWNADFNGDGDSDDIIASEASNLGGLTVEILDSSGQSVEDPQRHTFRTQVASDPASGDVWAVHVDKGASCWEIRLQ